MVYNNIANCKLHLGETQEAEKYICKVLDVEENNKTALYLQGVILLGKLLEAKNSDFSDVYVHFGKLLGAKSDEIGINSGWLISAVLLYEQKQDEKVMQNIVNRIKYSENIISMKSFYYLAELILQRLKNDNEKENILYRNFCHMKLADCGENQAFGNLMESMDFHYFNTPDRAFILAHIVQMYKYILHIKDERRFTYEDKVKMGLPYHYTKLSTLNCLLVEKGEEPKLRLWNSAYMNDRYEGGVFNKLLWQAALDSEDDIVKEEKDSLKSYFSNSIYPIGQTDSNVYITSFSTEKDSFQMWNIYGDNEEGAAIMFEMDFFDIKNSFQDLVWDGGTDEYALYKVNYHSETQDKIKGDLNKICYHICRIENRLCQLEVDKNQDTDNLFKSAQKEVRAFIADRLNEVRFLYKTQSYEYEKELRLIRVSHKCKIDDKNFLIPRLYIDVERKIENLNILLGGKLTNQQINNLSVWLENSGKVNKLEVSELNYMPGKVL